MRNVYLIAALKVFVMLTWLAASAGLFFAADSRFGQAGRTLLALLAVTHLVECVVFLPVLKKTGRPLGLELANTFFFGVAHFVEAKALVDAAQDPR
jgi:uncharacterized protein YhhL (DUF1145 family)